MPFQVSPGVNVSEIDLSTVVPAVSTTEGAIAGVFKWGPAETRVLVDSEETLAARFGDPAPFANGDLLNTETFFTAANFLAYGNKLYVSRVVDSAARNAGSNNALLIKNDDSVVQLTDASDHFHARYAGTLGNSIRVSVCDSTAAFETALTGSLTISSGASTGTSSADESSKVSVGDLIEVSGVALEVSAINEAGTGLTFAKPYTGVSDISVGTGVAKRKWRHSGLVRSAPGTSSYVSAQGGAGDEIHVVVEDEDGLITGTKGTILEVYEGVSRATDAKNEVGETNYWVDVIEARSQWIYAKGGANLAADGVAASISALSTTNPSYNSLDGGVESQDENNITLADVAAGYDLYKSAEDVDVSLILQGKAIGGTNKNGLANHLIDNVVDYRKDCVAFISPDKDDVVNNAGSEVDDTKTFRNGLTASSYAFMDNGYKYQYDKYSDKYRWIPLNGDIAGLAVRSDELRDAWFSPAGYNRGGIKNLVKLAYNPNKAQRDVLYQADINPIVTFPGQGTILFGDKTLLGKPSAFDRINVRRLFIILEKAISTASKFTLFEFNDGFTRSQFKNLVEPFLRDIQGRRGIQDFRVVCDETNNTGEVIDRNEFVGDIYIKPAKSINFIQLNFVAVRSGVEFSEIVGQF